MSGVGLDPHNSLTHLLENDDDEFNTIKMFPYYADADTCIASDIHRNEAFNYVSLNCGGLTAKYDYIKSFIEKYRPLIIQFRQWLYKKVSNMGESNH